MPDLTSLGLATLVTGPTIEPVSLTEIRSQLNLDSGSFADNVDQIQSLAPGLKTFIDDWTTHVGVWVEVLGYNAVVSFAAGAFTGLGTVDMRIQDSEDKITITTFGTDFIQVATLGMTTTAALGIGTTLTNIAYGLFSYFVAGIGYSKPALVAGVAPGADVIPMGKYGAVSLDIGADNNIDVVSATGNAAGYTTAVLAIAGIPAATAGHVRMGTVTVMKSDGVFTFGTTALNAANTTVAYTSTAVKANYGATYEKAYTGVKRYIRTIAKVLVADCSFGTSVIRSAASSVEDDLLTSLITTTREEAEYLTQRALLTQSWAYYLDGWPDTDYIKLPYGNLQDAAGTAPIITWKDTAGAITTMTVTTEYLVETNGKYCGRIVLPYGVSWPTTELYPSNPIKIEFVCGWLTAALIPSKIKTGIKMLCAKLYAGRGEDVVGQTVTEDKVVDRLLMAERLWDNAV